MQQKEIKEATPDLSGQEPKAIHTLILLAGCSPVLLDQVVPPLGIPTALFVIWFILKKQNRSLSAVGIIQPPNGWLHTLMLGVGGALLIFTLGAFVYPLLLKTIGLSGQDISGWEGIEGNNKMLAIYLTVSWTTAGFGEELIFRGTLMAGLARCFGMSEKAWAAAVVISSVLFGFIHIKTGIGGVLTTGINGAILAGVFLMSRRSIWAPYIAHGFANTISFLLIYSGLYKSLLS